MPCKKYMLCFCLLSVVSWSGSAENREEKLSKNEEQTVQNTHSQPASDTDTVNDSPGAPENGPDADVQQSLRDASPTDKEGSDEKSKEIKVDPLKMYQHLFKQKRETQREAVDTILKLQNHEKRYKMVDLILDKMFKIMAAAKVKLMEAGFIPGAPLPTDEHTRDAFAHTVENTAFFGDILLHLPDLTHSLLKASREGDMIVRWGVGFCNDTDVFVGADKALLELVAQELNIVDKDPNYTNPYKQDLEKLTKKLQEGLYGKEKKKEKKKKTIKKGPRLSGRMHTEL